MPDLSSIKPADLPAPPQAALAVLRACSDQSIDNRKLAGFAEMDPVLSAEMLRVVNSPLYGLGKEVNSVRHATALMGVNTLRNIVLCLMVREAAQSFLIAGFDISSFWEDSIRRAVAARNMAMTVSVDRDDAFTAGIIQDFGLLVLYYLHPEIADSFNELRRLTPDQRYQRELELFEHSHEQVLAALADSWALPEELIKAIRNHHQNDIGTELSRILYCADWLCSLFTSYSITRTLKQTIDTVQAQLGIDEDTLRDMLASLPVEVETSANAMGLHIKQQDDFEGLMRRANSILARENLSYQELNWQLEKALAERDRLAAELDREIAVAQEVQRKFMPEPDSNIPVYAVNLPARCISGDFYDYVQLDDGRIWFALGDVSGKGINAGLLMSKTASLFRCLARRMDNPQKLMNILNSEICETATRGFFVSLVIGLYSPEEKSVRLVNAGHLPVIIDKKGEGITRIEAVAQPIGILTNTDYPVSEAIPLQNSALYLYSDGVTETPVVNGDETEMLEEQGLLKLIRQYQTLSAEQRVEKIMEVISDMNSANDSNLHDDITLLLLEPR